MKLVGKLNIERIVIVIARVISGEVSLDVGMIGLVSYVCPIIES